MEMHVQLFAFVAYWLRVLFYLLLFMLLLMVAFFHCRPAAAPFGPRCFEPCARTIANERHRGHTKDNNKSAIYLVVSSKNGVPIPNLPRNCNVNASVNGQFECNALANRFQAFALQKQ